MLDYDSIVTFELSIQCKLEVHCEREVKCNEGRNKKQIRVSKMFPFLIVMCSNDSRKVIKRMTWQEDQWVFWLVPGTTKETTKPHHSLVCSTSYNRTHFWFCF